MREKIAEICAGNWVDAPDQILSLLKEEIEKMGNPYSSTRLIHPSFRDTSGRIFQTVNIKDEAFENARQAILKALES